MSTITCMCLRSVINLGNSIIGVSILAMPYCFKKCGILLSILLIVASGLITRAACHLLLKSAIMARRRNFEFLAFHTFGPTGKLIVEIGIIGFLIGVCVAFFVVVGDLSPALIAKFLMVENTSHLRAEILIFLGLFVAFPLGLLRKVDSLTSFSAMSIGFYIFLILIIIGEALPKLLNDDWWHQVNWWQPAGLLPSLPIFSMALSCQTQLFEFFDPLNDPSLKKMNSVINGAVQMCLAVYISVGFFGYVAFHDSPITGNILVRLTPSLTAEVIKVGFILSVVISFPLCLFPCRSSLHSLIFKQGMGHYDLQSSYMPDHRFRVLTCALVTATMGMAIMIPNIEFVLGLLGSTIGITICVILPALIFLHLTTKNTNERRMAQLVTFIGFFILIACTFSTLNESKSHEVISKLKPKIEETKIDKINKPVDSQIYESSNKDKENKNQEKNELKLHLRKEAEQTVKQNNKNNELNENKRQEPPVPQESDKTIVKPMPRNYKRNTETKYKLEDLEKAIEDVRSKKLTLGNAAVTYSVPKMTIFDSMKKEVIIQPKKGRKTIFTVVQEKQLDEYILECSKLFYGLTIEMVQKIAFTFAENNKLPHKFNKEYKMAGKDWHYGFLKRHPSISLRKPEATSLNRIAAFNETEVKLFFEHLESLLKKYHFDAAHIFNVDKTGMTNVQRNQKILTPKGQKQVGMATSRERGTTTTVVCVFSATGNYVPLFFIFKRKRMNPQLLCGGNADMIAAVSDSRWINENLFVDWLHHFIFYTKPSKENPILLILDNHKSHISLDCYILCRTHGIAMLSLLLHTSHRLQPLDLTYFGPLECI